MLRGLGDTFIETTGLPGGLTGQALQELFIYEFDFTSEATAIEALAYQAGARKVKASAEGEVTDSLTLRLQYNDWASLGFALDAFPKSATNVVVPTLKFDTVPVSGAFEITDTAVTAASDVYLKVFVNQQGTWGQAGNLERAATAATPGVGEVGVDTTNNKLIFNSAQAGAPISYTVPVTYAAIESFGGAGAATKYGDISFRGKVYSTEQSAQWPIYFPKLQRNGRPSIAFAGDVPILEIPFIAVTPSGWEQPYQILNPDTV